MSRIRRGTLRMPGPHFLRDLHHLTSTKDYPVEARPNITTPKMDYINCWLTQILGSLEHEDF